MPVNYIEHDGLFIHPDYVGLLQSAHLDGLQALLDTPGDATLGKPGLADWRQRVMLTVAGQRFFLKRYRQPPPDEQRRQRRLGFESTAIIELHWIGELRKLGVACPTAVAFGQQREGETERASVLLTAQVPGTSLEKWVRSDAAVALRDHAFRTRLIEHLADLTRTMHDGGLYHRDYYLAHLFLDMPGGRPEDIQITLIDLQRMIRSRRGGRWASKDLSALHYSAPADVFTCADRLRFYRRYFNRTRLGLLDRLTIRLLTLKSNRIARHSRKHQL